MAEAFRPGPAPAKVDEQEYELLMSAIAPSALLGTPSDPPLVYADSTGMHVRARPNRYAWVRGSLWWTDADGLIVPIDPNEAGSRRIDRVVLRLDRSDWSVGMHVVKGTPGGGEPAVTHDPPPTGVWEMEVANVNVEPGAVTINASDVSPWQRYVMPTVIANAGRHISLGGDERFAFRYEPDTRRLIFHYPQGSFEIYRDSGWVQLGSGASGWEATQPSYVRRVGSMVTLHLGNFRRTGKDIPAGTDSRLLTGSLPAEFRYAGPQGIEFMAMRGNGNPVRIGVYRDGSSTGRNNQVWLLNHANFPSGSNLYGTTVTWSV